MKHKEKNEINFYNNTYGFLSIIMTDSSRINDENLFRKSKTEIIRNSIELELEDNNKAYLDLVERINDCCTSLEKESSLDKNERIKLLNKLKEFILNIQNPITYYQKKLIWNEQKNVLLNIFKQLKQLPGQNNKPLLDNTYEEIAGFLKAGFSCFEGTSVDSIAKDMSKNKDVNKPSRFFKITSG